MESCTSVSVLAKALWLQETIGSSLDPRHWVRHRHYQDIPFLCGGGGKGNIFLKFKAGLELTLENVCGLAWNLNFLPTQGNLLPSKHTCAYAVRGRNSGNQECYLKNLNGNESHFATLVFDFLLTISFSPGNRFPFAEIKKKKSVQNCDSLVLQLL